MKRVLVAFTAVVIIAIGCIASVAGSTKTRAAEEDNIREAVYRYQFQHNASALKQNAKAYFLGIEKGKGVADPSDAFMKRFAGDSLCPFRAVLHPERRRRTCFRGCIALPAFCLPPSAFR